MAAATKPKPSGASKTERAKRAASAAGSVATGSTTRGAWGKMEKFFGGGGPQSLAAAETVTLGTIVAYDLLGAKEKKLPRPGPIVATVAAYGMMALLAAASETLRPAIVASGWVLALAVLLTGKRGQGLVGLLASIARLAAKTGQGGGSNG